jgi:ribosomal protein L39E
MKVFNVDGTPNKEGTITHFTQLKTRINGRIKRTTFLVAGLGKEKVILGFPWLQTESPVIDWEQGTLQWKDNSPQKEEDWDEEKEEKERIAKEMKETSKPVWIQAKTTPSQQITQKKEEQKRAVPLRQQIPRD